MSKQQFDLPSEGGISSSSSKDSDGIQSYQYYVFISFRGSDTRNSFVDHLYAYLVRKGIFAFKDDKQLQKGEAITSQLLQAIQHSRISIVVFSEYRHIQSPKVSQITRNRLRKTKLLIVLDNVEQLEKIEELDLKPKFLHTRSRIIAITRDKHILQAYGAHEVFEAKLMNDEDAHPLLCRKAFKSDYPSTEFAELIPKVLLYAQRLSLAVRVYSFLFSRNARQWSSTLDKFEKNPPNKILKVLHVSYEGLDKGEKEMFLHVACFFNGERKDYVSRILDACGLNPDIDIPLLAEKSLITIRNDEIHMHEMLHKLGKQVVQEQHPDEPKLWSRMWLYCDFHHAMIANSEAIKAKAIILNEKEDVSKFSQRCTKLSEVHPSVGLLEKLVFLSLQNCSSLVSLNFIDIESKLNSLRVLRLFGCTKLENSPDFTRALNREYLDMDQCKSLSTIHESIGTLAKLGFLSLRDCTNLVTIPECLNRMRTLVTLDLRGCLNFANLPLNYTGVPLIYLDLSFCNISQVPDAIGELTFLERLSLQGNKFTTIPSTIKSLSNISYLNLSHCHSLCDLPNLQADSGPSNSVGEYFKTTSGSRDHRSGLYFFDCP